MKTMLSRVAVLSAGFFASACLRAADRPLEGPLEPFLGEPALEMQPVFQGDRFPNVVIALDGTVVALWNGVKARRSEDGGRTWGPMEVEIRADKNCVTVHQVGDQDTTGFLNRSASEAFSPRRPARYNSGWGGKQTAGS